MKQDIHEPAISFVLEHLRAAIKLDNQRVAQKERKLRDPGLVGRIVHRIKEVQNKCRFLGQQGRNRTGTISSAPHNAIAY